ncbi:MAG: restriction endonuclease subunit S [Longimicrobiales bacterium]
MRGEVEGRAPWLAPLPANWDLAPLKAFVTDARNGLWGDPPEDSNDQVYCARVADFDRIRAVLSLSDPTVRSVPRAKWLGRLLQRGDLLLEKSGGGAKQPVGFVVLVEDLPGPTICSNFVARMPVAAGADPGFVRYLHQHVYSVRLNTRSIKQSTGIQNLDSGSYLQELAPRPPLPTQRAIASYLDRETARIDTMIEKKERLLELLEEKRTALITQAVTKGLDPDVPMKDSGVEWLGEVPAHWEVGGLRRCAAIVDCKHRTPEYLPEGVPVVSTSEVKPGVLDLDRCFRFVGDADYRDLTEGARLPQVGDLVYSRNASLGSAALVESASPFCMGQDVVIVRPKQGVGAYLMYVLNCTVVTSQVEAVGVGSTFSRINVSTIRDLVVPMPPPDEQLAISGMLRAAASTLDALSDRITRAIALLKEYRSALISAAVTGQIEVPDAPDPYT